MILNAAHKWLGDDFDLLHSDLQSLHLNGGELTGEVCVHYGDYLGGVIGKIVANSLKIPAAGPHKLSVKIYWDDNALHWNRCFNNSMINNSTFKPFPTDESQIWQETIGNLTLLLTVDIINGGWHWRTQKYSYKNVTVPRWLCPDTKAYKTIEDGKYRFYVGFSLPIIGKLFSYTGLLTMKEM